MVLREGEGAEQDGQCEGWREARYHRTAPLLALAALTRLQGARDTHRPTSLWHALCPLVSADHATAPARACCPRAWAESSTVTLTNTGNAGGTTTSTAATAYSPELTARPEIVA